MEEKLFVVLRQLGDEKYELTTQLESCILDSETALFEVDYDCTGLDAILNCFGDFEPFIIKEADKQREIEHIKCRLQLEVAESQIGRIKRFLNDGVRAKGCKPLLKNLDQVREIEEYLMKHFPETLTGKHRHIFCLLDAFDCFFLELAKRLDLATNDEYTRWPREKPDWNQEDSEG